MAEPFQPKDTRSRTLDQFHLQYRRKDGWSVFEDQRKAGAAPQLRKRRRWHRSDRSPRSQRFRRLEGLAGFVVHMLARLSHLLLSGSYSSTVARLLSLFRPPITYRGLRLQPRLLGPLACWTCATKYRPADRTSRRWAAKVRSGVRTNRSRRSSLPLPLTWMRLRPVGMGLFAAKCRSPDHKPRR